MYEIAKDPKANHLVSDVVTVVEGQLERFFESQANIIRGHDGAEMLN